MWARIVKDHLSDETIVAEVSDIDPSGRFHESIVWIKCSNSVMVNYVYRNGKFYQWE